MADITSSHIPLLRPPLCGSLNCKGGWEMSFRKEKEGRGEQLAGLSHSGGVEHTQRCYLRYLLAPDGA